MITLRTCRTHVPDDTSGTGPRINHQLYAWAGLSPLERRVGVRSSWWARRTLARSRSPLAQLSETRRAAECLVYSLTSSGVLAENHQKIGVSSASCGVKNA